MTSIAVIGAGIAGLLTAFKARQAGFDVHLYEAGSFQNPQGSSYFAGGMLAPYSELEASEKIIFDLGIASLPLWQKIVQELNSDIFFQENGTLILAHPQDQNELDFFIRQLQKHGASDSLKKINSDQIQTLEPELQNRFAQGFFLENEGQIDPRDILFSLLEYAQKSGVVIHEKSKVTDIGPQQITVDNQICKYDWIIDTRGIFAKNDLPKLRGVKGEMILLHAPDVTLNRPIRIMHPRYPLYVIPRANHVYMLGATQVENEQEGMHVRSALELLSAAYSLHSGFSEAKILEFSAHFRPTLPDHLPQIQIQGEGLLRLNGLYRHGYLIGPAMVDLLFKIMLEQPISKEQAALIQQG